LSGAPTFESESHSIDADGFNGFFITDRHADPGLTYQARRKRPSPVFSAPAAAFLLPLAPLCSLVNTFN
jgi:hypothetical protein